MLLQSGQEACVVRSLTNRILLKMLLAVRIHWNPLPKHWVEGTKACALLWAVTLPLIRFLGGPTLCQALRWAQGDTAMNENSIDL